MYKGAGVVTVGGGGVFNVVCGVILLHLLVCVLMLVMLLLLILWVIDIIVAVVLRLQYEFSPTPASPSSTSLCPSKYLTRTVKQKPASELKQ